MPKDCLMTKRETRGLCHSNFGILSSFPHSSFANSSLESSFDPRHHTQMDDPQRYLDPLTLAKIRSQRGFTMIEPCVVLVIIGPVGQCHLLQ
jgi:hypothetical protein